MKKDAISVQKIVKKYIVTEKENKRDNTEH